MDGLIGSVHSIRKWGGRERYATHDDTQRLRATARMVVERAVKLELERSSRIWCQRGRNPPRIGRPSRAYKVHSGASAGGVYHEQDKVFGSDIVDKLRDWSDKTRTSPELETRSLTLGSAVTMDLGSQPLQFENG
jgi:hypothetical protein